LEIENLKFQYLPAAVKCWITKILGSISPLPCQFQQQEVALIGSFCHSHVMDGKNTVIYGSQ